ncbi:putative PHD type zinc finger protein with BAH domain-containing protein [Linderina pennispora]|nr:putative PHD type zinc finger protein with BAH domain-containing protein [Linderina pennispora]
MWRTSGNNWVHSICALAVPETTLFMVNGSIVVNAIPTIPEKAWHKPCGVCPQPDGAVVGCTHRTCSHSAHPVCAQIFIDEESDEQKPVLVARARGRTILARDVLKDISEFVTGGGKIDIALQCATHADIGSDRDIDLRATDPLGRSVLSGVVSTKLVSTPHARGAMLHSSLIKSRNAKMPAVSKSSSAASSRSSSKRDATGKTVKMSVEWQKNLDPVCAHCASSVSPIWWPLTTGGSTRRSHSSVSVLCHRCHSSHASQPNASNVAS